MVINIRGQKLPCVRAEKGVDYVRAYAENGTCIFEAADVVDFDGYVIEGGDWSQPEMSEEERIEELEALVAALLFGEMGGDGE